MRVFVDTYGLRGFEHIADPGSGIWRAFQITAQPSFVFIDDDGEIRRHIGSLSLEELSAELDLLDA